VVQLEPLFACNLRCPGCGKTEHPPQVLSRRMSAADALCGVMESGAPVVSIAGGEPLLHPDIVQIVDALVDRRLSVYLCTNGLLLRDRLDLFRPSPYFAWVVHLDGIGEDHDRAVGREGVFAEAAAAVREAKGRGFRVTTNSTVFAGTTARQVADLLDFLCVDLGVDAVMLSPGFGQEGALDQAACLSAVGARALFREVFADRRRRRWRFNHSPLYLDFLTGQTDLPCTPWAVPSYSVLGWQRPCYMWADGYAATYRELLDTTDWARYGRGKDPRCADCLAHSGHEPSAVLALLRSPLTAVRSYLRR
jgi:hopanoid biosynthesis associated radical SAM protein HpnH